MERAPDPTTIDQVTLNGPVRRALGHDAVEILAWQCETLHGGLDPRTGGVYRFTGRARAEGMSRPWSLVLKVATSAGDDHDPSAANYWKREFLAYRSGLLDDLPAGIAAPRCFGVAEHGHNVVWLWLEDVVDACGSSWPLACYGRAARHLGHFNGTYSVARAMPTAPWLSNGWLREWIAPVSPDVSALSSALEQPLMRRACPGTSAARLLAVSAERETFLVALDRLPPTFCHHDVFQRNMFLRQTQEGSEQAVLIDWAEAGQGALGQDLAGFVFGPVNVGDLDVTLLQELDNLAWSNYLDGLREAGWRGDARTVRLAYALTGALWSLRLAEGYIHVLTGTDSHAHWERTFGRSMEEMSATWGGVLSFLMEQADEACRLLQVL